MKILNLYFSATGNTEKVAMRISETAEKEGHTVDTVKGTHDTAINFLDYDFVFIGSGVYFWLPGEPLMKLLKGHLKSFVEKGDIMPAAPKRAEKKAVIYCTYGGAHTGVNEAVPSVKYMEQLFDHLGFTTVGEWYVVGEYVPDNFKHMSVGGKLGDIRGKPNEQDLHEIAEKAKEILKV